MASQRTIVILWSVLWPVVWSLVSSVLPPLSYEILEGQGPGLLIGYITNDARLEDSLGKGTLRELRFRITGEERAANLFSVDPETSELRTKQTLDREAICPGPSDCLLNFDVAATRSSPDFYDVVAVTVTIIDVNDNVPRFPEPVFHLAIPESAVPGPTALFSLPLAHDPDSRPNSISAYKLVSDYDNFGLHVVEAAGAIRALQLTLLKAVDREDRENYEVTIQAEDGGPSPGTLTVNITVADANDHGPTFRLESYVVHVPEDTPVTSTLLRVTADDEDVGANGRVSYQLTSASAQLLRQFSIDEATGDIVLRQPLDYETEKTHHLIVQAQDGGLNPQLAYCDVTIHVSDVNDQAPSIAIHTLAGTMAAQVSEAASRGQFVAHVTVKDPDSGPGGQFTCYSDNDQFQLRPLSDTRFELVTATTLDREQQETAVVGVVCTDGGSPALSSSRQLEVAVMDANDNAPIFSQSTYRVEIAENNQGREVILKVTASDLDLGVNGQLTYSIKDDPFDHVTIDSRTGEVRANAVFDYESEQEVAFAVEAKDGGVPAMSSSVAVVLIIRDINDEPPRFSQDLFTFSIYENAAAGAQVGTLQASDADSPPYDRVEYSLVEDGSGLFTIDPLSGVLLALAPLDRELSPRHELLVVASNAQALPPLSATATVRVEVLDVNDNAPVITFPSTSSNRSVALSSHVPLGYRVASIIAHDADMGTRSRLHFALVRGNHEGYFEIDRETGALTTAKDLSSFDLRIFALTVSVSDGGLPPLGAEAVLHVTVNRSLAYDDRGALLSRNNVTIVVALSVVSAVIVVILLAAIVVIKTRDVRQRREKSRNFRYSIECQKKQATREVAVLGDQLGDGPEVAMTDREGGQKDINLFANQHLPSSTHQLQTSVNEIPKPQLPPKNKRTTGQKQTRERKNQGDTSQPGKKSSGEDSDSAYSGDMSNTDSGQGPSIDSYDYNHAHIPHHPPPRPGSRAGPPPQYKDIRAKRQPQSIPQMIANNTHPCVNGPSPKKNNFRARNAPLGQQRQWNTPTTNNYPNTHTLSSLRSWESLPEDDGSTTSGSYVVDLADVEEAENLSHAVTV